MIRVKYQDNYTNLIFEDTSSIVPRIGDEVIISDLETYRVKNVAWDIQAQEVLVTVAEDQMPGTKRQQPDVLTPLRAELASLKESVSKQEKKTRLLGDSLQSLSNRVKSTEASNKKNDTR